MSITAGDLPESTLHSEVVLFCDSCEEEFSATRGDYWYLDATEVMHCQYDGTELRLGRWVSVWHDLAELEED